MVLTERQDLSLKIGNLFLAIALSIVPTTITLAILGGHGYLLCERLNQKVEQTTNTGSIQLSESCMESNLEELIRYVVWIWIFISIPTWRWFYIGHVRRVKSSAK